MPDTSPTPVDLDEFERWVLRNGPVNARISDSLLRLIAEVRRLRASIGPDSERIRELEAEVARLRDAWATDGQRANEAECLLNELRAGLLPGPDDIVVSRELAEALVSYDDCDFDHHGGCQAHSYLSLQPGEICPQRELKDRLAALSQPHPAQEQQT